MMANAAIALTVLQLNPDTAWGHDSCRHTHKDSYTRANKTFLRPTKCAPVAQCDS